MNIKKIIGIIALIAIAGIGFFIFILYATIKTKSTSLSKYEPYREWIGKIVILDKETVVFKEKIRMNPNSKYPYILLDDLHPQWKYVLEQQKTGDVDKVAVFPAGAKLTLEKAVQYTNGVSGTSYPTIFGTISNGKQIYKVGYQWGNRDFSKSFNDYKSWYFHKAPWQNEEDTVHYTLPEARWW